MNKQPLIIITVALVGILLIAGGTATMLNYLDRQNKPSQQEEEKKEPVDSKVDEIINSEANLKAQAAEQQAVSLMHSDPKQAYDKYLEAEQAYRDAGNMNKVGEMMANAQTAELHAQENTQQSGEQN